MDKIKLLVDNYQTPIDAKILIEKSQVLLLAGISGAGKDTTKKHLLKNAKYRDIVSHTTRSPRCNNGQNEIDGVDYNFISTNEAEKMLLQKKFVEVKFVHNNIYGTSVAEIERGYDNNQISITDIDIQGIAEYEKISPNVVSIFILPPNYEIWRQRFSNRYNNEIEFENDFIKRLPEAISSLERALDLPYFHFILNDDFRNTARIIDQIVHQDDKFNYKDVEVRLRAEKLLDDIKSRV